MKINIIVYINLFIFDKICAALLDDKKTKKTKTAIANPIRQTKLRMQLEKEKTERTKAWIQANSVGTADGKKVLPTYLASKNSSKVLDEQMDSYSERLKNLKIPPN